MKRLFAEFLGTFFLVFVIASSGDPLAIGLILAIMIYTLGPISGGHFNPAVTLGLLISKNMKVKLAVNYMIVQFLGAFAAALLFFLLNGAYFSPSIAPETAMVKALAYEAIFTFALVLVVLSVAVSKRTKGNQMYGLAIGLTVFVGATAAASISGAAFNPAVGVAPLILNFSNLASNMQNILLYIVGPFVGAIGASLVYNYLENKPD